MNAHKILIVEDDFINARFITQAVTKFGCKVVGRVKRGDDALEIVKNQQVDIVFMDINIEGHMDGISCAKAINAIKQNFRDIEKPNTNEEFTRINQHYCYYPKTKTLKRNEETVRRLRKKIPQIQIITVVGIGYRLEGCA